MATSSNDLAVRITQMIMEDQKTEPYSPHKDEDISNMIELSGQTQYILLPNGWKIYEIKDGTKKGIPAAIDSMKVDFLNVWYNIFGKKYIE